MSDAAQGAPVLIDDLSFGILTLTLNRPAQRNSLSDALIASLSTAIGAAGANSDVRCIVIAANGPAFCAGHDLKEMQAHRDDPDAGHSYYRDIMIRCSQMMQTIVRCPKPVIAQVHGVATAAGCQLVASCDLAIAETGARFATPGVNIGLFCSTPMVALSRNLARKHAMEMLLLGEMVSAENAAAIGLINHAVEPGALSDTVQAMANTIAAKSAHTVAIGKEAFYVQLEKGLDEAYDYASEVMAMNMMSHDAVEGIGAFLEKRTPEWRDR